MRGGKLGEQHVVPGPVTGTCGSCPCCLKLRAHRRKKNAAAYLRRKRSNTVSDTELERRLLASSFGGFRDSESD